MMREIHVHIAFGVKTLRGAMAASLLVVLSAPLGSESTTLTTYYPAPMGIYKTMTTTSDTVLARDGGNVDIGTVSHMADLVVTSTSGANYFQVTEVAVADAPCASIGLVARDIGGLLLYCHQSLVWKAATGGGGGSHGGGYTFHINSSTVAFYGFYINSSTVPFYGIGQYDSGASAFYGRLTCDPATGGSYCGSHGTIFCGTDTSCAVQYAQNGWLVIDAFAVPISSVTQKW